MPDTMTDTPPEQPTIPDVVEEPVAGTETIVEMDPETTPTEPPSEQPALIPMTEDELREAGGRLAAKVQTLMTMKTLHQGKRSEMKKEREELQKEINSLAQTIRQQGR